jgi:hypothetical protein
MVRQTLVSEDRTNTALLKSIPDPSHGRGRAGSGFGLVLGLVVIGRPKIQLTLAGAHTMLFVHAQYDYFLALGRLRDLEIDSWWYIE